MVTAEDLKSSARKSLPVRVRPRAQKITTTTMPIFYTGKGDKGVSHVGKIKIKKTCLEIESLGYLDELNSLIGVVKSFSNQEFKKILHEVQESLFIIQANVAYVMLKERRQPPLLGANKVKTIEELLDKYEKILSPAKKFVISGPTLLSAWLDYVRAYSRRVERNVLRIPTVNKLNPEILRYLNRLSSLFFAMARMATKQAGKKELHPSYK